jgi:hypothetical protein
MDPGTAPRAQPAIRVKGPGRPGPFVVPGPAAVSAGSSTPAVMVVPRPGALATSRRPPSWSTRWAMARRPNESVVTVVDGRIADIDATGPAQSVPRTAYNTTSSR